MRGNKNSKKNRLAERVKRGSLLLGSIVLILALFEYVIIPLLGELDDARVQPHPQLGWTYTNDARLVHYTRSMLRRGEETHRVEIITNANGFRDDEWPSLQGGSGEKVVLVLGDSFTAGIDVAFGDTFHQQLEQLSEGQIKSVNFGVEGYSTAQSFSALRKFGSVINPDIVILAFFAGNDVEENNFVLSQERRRPYYTSDGEKGLALRLPPVSAWKYPWFKRAMQSNLAQLAVDAWEGLNPNFGWLNPRGVFAQHLDECSARSLEAAWSTTRALINAIAAKSKAFLVVIIPAPFQLDETIWGRMIHNPAVLQSCTDHFDRERPQRFLREALTEMGIAYVDLLPVFKDLIRGGRTLSEFYDGHFREAGHRVMAQEIFRALETGKMYTSLPSVLK